MSIYCPTIAVMCFREVRRGFTLVEAMVAAIVLVLGITTAITTLQYGLRALDTARNLTAASQVMQSEIERLRLKSWAQIQALQDAHDTAVAVESGAGTARFTCQREIRDIKTDMKEIVIMASWNGMDGRPHSARLMTRYCRSGLNDYYYTVH